MRPVIREAVVVEGRYDVAKLHQAVDALILKTDGFAVFNDTQRRALLRRIAQQRGIIVLCDSDSAGFLIRNHLRAVLPRERVKHAYIPEIAGKERRKRDASREGLLGVEGMTAEVIRAALLAAGATVLDGCGGGAAKAADITKADLYEWGLSGGRDSAARRKLLLSHLELPSKMSANAMLEALRILCDREALERELAALFGDE